MKHYNPKALKPSSNELFGFTKDKLSPDCQQSIAYKVVASLFSTAQRLYRALDESTSDRLPQFVDKHAYLTQLQEHDLAALTAKFVSLLDIQLARDVIKQDSTITVTDQEVLLTTVDLFHNSVSATCAALGNPRWVE